MIQEMMEQTQMATERMMDLVGRVQMQDREVVTMGDLMIINCIQPSVFWRVMVMVLVFLVAINSKVYSQIKGEAYLTNVIETASSTLEEQQYSENAITDAIQIANDLIQEFSRSPRAYIFRSFVWQLQGNNKKALEDVDIAIKLNKDNAESYVQKGDVLFYDDPDLALHNYNQALELDPENLRALFKRGMIYNIRENSTKAQDEFKKGLKNHEKNKN